MRVLLILIAVIALVVSTADVNEDRQGIVDLFELGDPTGSFGIYFHLGGLAANLAVVLVAICVLLPRSRSDVRPGIALVVFVPPLIQALAILPCFLSPRPGALCGVGAVMVAYVSIPIVLVAAIAFIATAALRLVKVAGMTLVVAFLGFAAAAHTLLAPSHPDECGNFAEVTKRSNCLKAFAERGRDETLCRSIEFRTTRFTCLREIAVEKRQPELCDEIAETGPIAKYESPAVLFRDTCFQNLAYAMHDRSQCAKVADAPLRASCEAHNP